MKTVLITGATSGIGLACAYKFAENGYYTILTGRRCEKLEKVASDIDGKYGNGVKTLCFDIREKSEVFAAVEEIKSAGLEVDVLINNAGLAVGLNKIQQGDIDDWERMIDTNIKGLLYVSRALLPMMTKRKSGHVINIGSIAGREVYPNGNVYCATKFAVDALTKAMRIDTLESGIKVTQIAPGAVETEFSIVRFKGDEDKAKSVYKGYEPLHPGDIAEVCYYVTTLPPHVNINDMLVMPVAQANATLFHKEPGKTN
jgi:NADP-dependent 3-hydroxy acid dehydrogenase YdfG